MKIQVSPLAQRVQFLEAKGLNSAEIDEAMRQAALQRTQFASPSSAAPYGPPYAPVYGLQPFAGQPLVQPWDWRDYFVSACAPVQILCANTPQITAVVSGSIAYVAASLFRVRYPATSIITCSLMFTGPEIRPPASSTAVRDCIRS